MCVCVKEEVDGLTLLIDVLLTLLIEVLSTLLIEVLLTLLTPLLLVLNALSRSRLAGCLG